MMLREIELKTSYKERPVCPYFTISNEVNLIFYAVYFIMSGNIIIIIIIIA